MPVPFFISVSIFIASSLVLLAWSKARQSRRNPYFQEEEIPLWSGLAAALFDAHAATSLTRTEIALAALSRKAGHRYSALLREEDERVIAVTSLRGALPVERGARFCAEDWARQIRVSCGGGLAIVFFDRVPASQDGELNQELLEVLVPWVGAIGISIPVPLPVDQQMFHSALAAFDVENHAMTKENS